MANHKLLGVFSLTLLALSLCFYIPGSDAQIDHATSKLQTSKTVVEQAFNSVSCAEKAHVNVTSLLEQLNTAASLLAQAENFYRIGDLDVAVNFADQASQVAQQVGAQANAAQEAATKSVQTAFWVTVASVAVGSFLLILGLFLGWRLFKKRYINIILDAKPEVTNN